MKSSWFRPTGGGTGSHRTWITGAHVQRVEPGVAHYETLDGATHALPFDFAMLLPPFSGVGLQAFDRTGADVTSVLFAPNRFMRVDADYTAKPYEQWRAEDWPKTYQVPGHPNIFAVGIAFAPPHGLSKPHKSANGTNISPSPPRTGQPAGVMGRAAALSIIDQILHGPEAPPYEAWLGDMGAGCIASAGAHWRHGSAASMTMYPVVPDFQRFPGNGRDPRFTFGEIGSAGHWIKGVLHYMFLYKAKGRPLWWLIPEQRRQQDYVEHVGTDLREAPMTTTIPSDLERVVIKPTPLVLFARRFVPYQLYRFVWINLRMLAMIRKSHPHPRRPGP
jgi:sulfide:quinone oxidoreductase